MEIHKHNLRSLRSMLDKREISAVELVELYIKRIKEVDHKTNSYITICEEEALLQAKEAQKLINSGSSGSLTGIPVSLKDNICTKDIRTTCASKMLEDFYPPYDATVVKKLKACGAVLLGKTNMDEFAMGGSSQTSYFGGVKNPYDLSRVPGGSSGGAAVSVAAGLAPVSLGSDTGGSIRQPASFCGVTGLKPTYGTVSRYGLIAFASSLDQIGPIAKSAEDCGIILDSIAGYDSDDPTTAHRGAPGSCSKIGMPLNNLKIGIPKEFFGDGINEEVKAAVFAAVKEYEKMGCQVLEVSFPSLKYAIAAYYLISSAEASSNLSRYDGIKFGYRSKNGESYEELIKNTRAEGFGDEVKRRILLGTYALSSGYYDDYYKKAAYVRQKIKEDYNRIFNTCDVIITPTAPTTAYMIGEQESNPVKMYLADICTVTVNIAGLPAISTTCGYDGKGMPIGMSIVGRPFDESTIIGVADAFERNFERQEVSI
ncbi:Asp-tRNA(Asn)/Glu-tRNA(Gln) amidotransferase subunit GatA [Pseudoclostridium thermosuccinogenes]|uniref:Asp-tRNA(Asn)/Glu-tRNA(Gln) amidotransferase subunit GatA n=1 Tax=Clostridium thermosuccinogenes TaxID=84032 RepID=UPI002FD9752A